MIVIDEYTGDCNKHLKDVQHEMYGASVWKIFEMARKQTLFADALLMTNLASATKLREIRAFDHRVLQDAHDLLAAGFRRTHDDGGQFGIFDATDQDVRYIRQWNDWLQAQLVEIGRYPSIVREITTAVLYANTDAGYEAEQRLLGMV